LDVGLFVIFGSAASRKVIGNILDNLYSRGIEHASSHLVGALWLFSIEEVSKVILSWRGDTCPH